MKPSTLFSLSSLTLALAAAPISANASEIENLKQRIDALEQKAATPGWSDKVTFSGTVEVEASYTDAADWENKTATDLVVSTVELGIDAQITDDVSAILVLLYEEDDTDLNVDLAIIEVSNLLTTPLTLTVGQGTVPFGALETNLSNDTLITEIAETGETFVMLGLEQNGLSGAIYAFNGDVNKDNDTIQSFGITIGYENEQFRIGAGYLNNILDSDGLTDGLGLSDVDKLYGAYIVNGQINFGNVRVLGEFFQSDKLEEAGDIKPSAYQLEVAADFGDVTVAAAYQASDDAVDLLPETRVSIGATWNVHENIALSAEYWHDENYSEAGTDEDSSNNLLGKIAISF